MKRKYLLTAELFNYSYANYYDLWALEILDLTGLMPKTFETLERATREGWTDPQIAKGLDVEEDTVDEWKRSYQRAVDIIDPPNASEHSKER